VFSLDSYVETAWTYMGLEKRAVEGKDISKISSVASFLSRIDSNIDKQLMKNSTRGLMMISPWRRSLGLLRAK